MLKYPSDSILLDLETKSGYNLKTCGLHRYVESPDFTILMLAYKWKGFDEVHIIDLTKQSFPKWLIAVLLDKRVIKRSHNAAFERTALAKYLGLEMPANQWRCSLVQAARAGYPLGLDAAAKASDCGVEKMTEGSGCIKYFSSPCKPTKVNGGRTWNLPEHDPAKFEIFKEYCKHDVRTEVAVLNKSIKFPVSDFEHQLWELDQKINDTGVLLDRKLVLNALRIYDNYVAKLKIEQTEITGLQNSNSPVQLRAWLIENGQDIPDMRKGTIADLLADLKKGDVSRVLEIRQEMSKTSVKKFSSMKACMCDDGRVRGLLQFYGANRTGRWAGRLIQVQNLPQNKLKVDEKLGIDDLGLARDLVRRGKGALLEKLFGNVPDVLSQLIRTAFVAPEGSRLIVADLAAIEARIVSWLFGEKWRMDVFAGHGKIYEESASRMFKVPLETIFEGGENYHLRAKGKVAELALSYQGAIGAMINMGALKMGLHEDELLPIIKAWRKENPSIVRGWYKLQEQVEHAIVQPGKIIESFQGIQIQVRNKNLYIKLPSGRELAYTNVRLIKKRGGYGNRQQYEIVYQGMDQVKKTWTTTKTYSGKLTENIVQAIARDVLAVGLMRMEYKGYKIVFHVHDEIVAEMKNGKGSLKECVYLMSKPISWAPGLVLGAAGFETNYYKK